MSGQRRWLKVWARTVGMPVGISDEDKPEFPPIKQIDVKKPYYSEPFGLHFTF